MIPRLKTDVERDFDAGGEDLTLSAGLCLAETGQAPAVRRVFN